MKSSIKRIYIEITSRCNLNCAFCTAGSRQGSDMDPVFFESILKQVREVTPYIYLHVQGEPLLHRDFSTIMDLCDNYEMQVQLVTNGTLLARYPDLLRHPSLRKISFSMQSIEYHSRDEIALLKEILSFCQQASAQKHPYCEIRFWRDDQLEQRRTENCLAYLQEYYDFRSSDRKNNYAIMDHVYVDFHNTFTWPSMSLPELSRKGRCLGGIRQLAVLCDGTAVPCCLDAEGNIPLGSLHDQTLAEILAGSRYQNLCQGFQNNELREELCRRCPYRQRFDQKI